MHAQFLIGPFYLPAGGESLLRGFKCTNGDNAVEGIFHHNPPIAWVIFAL
jgi:hypothetical protein